ncbi:MAG: GNAT family N-acetyltransferase [Bacteroidia bacterium]|nr:GNAT family N-acetyltransferase [Bacteroidia bacterium]
MKAEISIARETQELEEAYLLRWTILRKPWQQPKGSEQDELEAESITVVARENKLIVGTGRVHMAAPGVGQIRYMAVAGEVQGKGVGKQILCMLEEEINKRGAQKVFLNSRENAVKFYLANGYTLVKEVDKLYGVIRHFLMEKSLLNTHIEPI